MADETKKDAAPPPPPGPSKIFAILSMVVPAVLAGGASYAGSMMGAAQAIATPPSASADPDAEKPGPTVRLAPIVLSLTDDKNESHAMKVSLAVELSRDANESDFEGYVPRARDATIRLLRGLSYEDATNRSTHQKLRDKILEELHALGATQAKQIWFIDFVIQ
ncbi:MAG: flagellar basal body-associated FliL family protein [Polyangiaceae bacterium]